MSCTFTEKISSLIDGELAADEAREVEHHLLNCNECEQTRADFLNLRSQIAGFETSLKPAVQNRALKKILAPERQVPARGLQWGFGTQAAAFATLVIVAAIIGLLAYQSSNQRKREEAVAINSPAPAPTVGQARSEPSPEPGKGTQQPAPKKDSDETTTPARLL